MSNVYRLKEIQDEMEKLLHEARDIVRGTPAEPAADSYWIPTMRQMLGDPAYFTHATTMQDTIDELLEHEGVPTCEDCGEEIPPRDVAAFRREAGVADACPRICEDCAEHPGGE